jgi:hypothetical protein
MMRGADGVHGTKRIRAQLIFPLGAGEESPQLYNRPETGSEYLLHHSHVGRMLLHFKPAFVLCVVNPSTTFRVRFHTFTPDEDRSLCPAIKHLALRWSGTYTNFSSLAVQQSASATMKSILLCTFVLAALWAGSPVHASE